MQNVGVIAARYPVTSVDRALLVVRLLGARGALRVNEVAAELDVAQSTAHRLLAMLVEHGFAVRDGRHVYGVGPALGQRESRRPSVRMVVRPYLQQVAARTGETVHLMVLEGASARFVDVAEGATVPRVTSRIGLVFPAHLTSGGKALLAELDERSLSERFPRRPRLTAGASGPDLARLRRELASVRRRGFAVNTEETEVGIVAIGACVRDPSGQAVTAMVIGSLSARRPGRRIVALAPVLIEATKAASTDLAAAHAGDSGCR